MYQSKVDKSVLYLIFVLSFYSHIYLSVIHFTFCNLFLHICFVFLDLPRHQYAEYLLAMAMPKKMRKARKVFGEYSTFY